MNKEEIRLEVAALLEKRARLASFHLELSPGDLMLLKRLLFRLGETNVKFARSKVKFEENPSLDVIKKFVEASSDQKIFTGTKGLLHIPSGKTYLWNTEVGEPHHEKAAKMLKMNNDDFAIIKFAPSDLSEQGFMVESRVGHLPLPQRRKAVRMLNRLPYYMSHPDYREEFSRLRLARLKNAVRKYAASPEGLRSLAVNIIREPKNLLHQYAYVSALRGLGHEEAADIIESSLGAGKSVSFENAPVSGRYRVSHDVLPHHPQVVSSGLTSDPRHVYVAVPEIRQIIPPPERNYEEILAHAGRAGRIYPEGQSADEIRPQTGTHFRWNEAYPYSPRTKMARLRSALKRYAKIDTRHTIHPLVAGFPIETALRHLANADSNPPSIRGLAATAATGGPKGEAANVQTALWLLHDELHKHNHPAKDWYNWMSAADKIGLDAHTHRALTEAAEDQRRSDARSGTVGTFPNLTPDANGLWTGTPESHAVMAVQGMDNLSVNSSYSINRKALLDRIRNTVKGFVPHVDESDIDESIRRHAHRSARIWRRLQAGPAGPPGGLDESREEGRDLGAFKERNFPVPRPHLNLNEKATRYRRLYNRLNSLKLGGLRKYALSVGPGSPNLHKSFGGEDIISHPYHDESGKELGTVDVIPRNEGRTVHIHWIGPRTAGAGEQNHLNSLGHENAKSVFQGLRQHYPDAHFVTGRRPSGKHVVREIPKLFQRLKKGLRKYAAPFDSGNFIDALRQVRSSQQQSRRKIAENIAEKLGISPTSTIDGLFDSTSSGASPGVLQAIYGHASPEKIHAAASWYALTSGQAGVSVFHPRANGTDALHRFRAQGSGAELRNRLDRAGLSERILVPHRSGFDVLIPDQGRQSFERVKAFTEQQKVELQSSPGFFKLIGDSDKSSARAKFRGVIEKQEHGPSKMNRLKKFLHKFSKKRTLTIPIERIIPDKDNMEVAVHSLQNGREATTGGPLKVHRAGRTRNFILADGHHRLLRDILNGETHTDVQIEQNGELGESAMPSFTGGSVRLKPDQEHFGLGKSLENGWLLNRLR